MVQFSYLILWAFAGFGLLVAASFAGTMLALQYYNSGRTLSVSLDDIVSRLNNDKP
ncbi:hypothetical protein [Haloarcula rubripromontorii]|uniref:Uncharacterized protein n=1 Tax=Haloarcula rubripromontorii TaxID=1705562 RepID=A0A847TYS6_9EURY|nr:hypothetical protein [Haloarcula rubripromontorii]NLV05759.1 hypothetical protein [Haloarcula rubripromontorii]